MKYKQHMSNKEREQYRRDLQRGLDLAEYRMLRDKAMHNLSIVQSDGEGGCREVSAREVFEQLYHEPVPAV